MMKMIVDIEYETFNGPFGRTTCNAHISSYEDEESKIPSEKIVDSLKKLFGNLNYGNQCATFSYRDDQYEPYGTRHGTGRIFGVGHGSGWDVVIWDEHGEPVIKKRVPKATKKVIMELFNDCADKALTRPF